MKKVLALLLAISMIACFVPMFAAVSAKEAPKITVDGKVDDWKDLNSLSLVGKDETSDKSVVFYGYRATDGLYMACKTVHLKLITDNETWWKNSNFEIFVWNNADRNTQYWVRTGMEGETVVPVSSDNISSTSLTCVKDGDHYTTVIEVFIANDKLPEKQKGAAFLPLGCAWKTNNEAGVYDDIKGGGGNEYDSYWVLPHCWPGMCSLIATNSGLYTGYDHWEIKDGTFMNTGRVRWPHFTTYMLGETTDEVTLSATLTVKRTLTEPEDNGGDYGFFFGVKDNNGDGIIQESGDLYYLVDLQANGVLGIERNNGGWGGWYKPEGSDVEGYQTGATEGQTVKVTATYKNGNIKVYINDGETPVLDYTDAEPLAGTGYALASKVTNGVFKDVKVNGATPNATAKIPTATYTTGTDAPPKTGDAAVVVIAAVAIVSLAAVALVATKRKMAE